MPRSGSPQIPECSDDETGVPALPTWRHVYIFVVGAVLLWIALLTLLMRTFS